MPLSIAERKHRMPHGAQKEIADDVAGGDQGYVSRAMSAEVHPKTEQSRQKLRRTQEAIAEKLGMPIDEVFGPRELVLVAMSA